MAFCGKQNRHYAVQLKNAGNFLAAQIYEMKFRGFLCAIAYVNTVFEVK
jgi:hypothetical protein